MVTGRDNHPPHLVILALGNGHFQQSGFDQPARLGRQGFVFIFEKYAGQKAIAYRLVSRLGQHSTINFWYCMLGRGQHMDALPIIGEQEQAVRIDIQATHWLDISFAQGARQEGQNARVMLGCPGTFVANRFVEQNISVLAVWLDAVKTRDFEA